MRFRSMFPVGLWLAAHAVSCGFDASDEATGAADAPSASGDGAPAPNDNGANPGERTPEQFESQFRAPVTTREYVWVANPSSGRVALIHAPTLAVQSLEAGHGPTYVGSVPSATGDSAIVLNVLSKDATLFSTVEAKVSRRSFQVPSGGNRWSISKDGAWAIAWSDATEIAQADPIDGFQDLTVLHLASKNDESRALAVGYRPTSIAFSKEADQAFVVTEDGISEISLPSGAEPQVVANISFGPLPDDKAPSEVIVIPEADIAVARWNAAPVLRVIDLFDAETHDIALNGPANDMDLSSDGKSLVLAIESVGEGAVVSVDSLTSGEAIVTPIELDSPVSSVTLPTESSVALFYGTGSQQTLIALDLAEVPLSPKATALKAPIQAVFPTETGDFALVVHAPKSGSTWPSAYPAAVSLVPIATNLPPKIVGLDADVQSVAISPSGGRAIFAVGTKSAPFSLHVAAFDTLEVAESALSSKPISSGIVATANIGFVAQEHPDGRITFVNFDHNEIRTLTGFELAASVIYGAAQ